MAEKKLKASLVIGGLIDSSFKTVLTDTKSGFRQIGDAIKSANKNAANLNIQMDEMKAKGGSLDVLTARYDSMTKAIKRAEEAQKNLRKAEAFRNRMNSAADQSRFMAGRAGAGAVAGALLMKNILSESSALQTENAKLKVMGVPDEAKKQALKAGESLKTFGTTIRENVQAYNDGLAVFGNMHEASIAAPLMAKMKFASAALFNTSAEESERQQQYGLRVVDIRGGASDPEEFKRQAGFMQQALNASNGLMNQSKFFEIVSHGGTAVKGMSNEALYYKSIPVAIEMGAPQYGTALQTTYNSLMQGHTSKRAAMNLMKDGLIGDPSKVKFDKVGQAAQINPGALKGSDLFARDPAEWVKSVMLPAFVAKGIISKDTYNHALSGSLTEADRAKINLEAATLGNSSVGKLLATFATNLAPIARDTLNASRSQGIDGSVDAAKGTAKGQEMGLHAQLTNLRLNLGMTLLPTYVSLLQKANTVLDRFNGFIKAHPRLTRMATVGILATTGALAAAVPVLLVAGSALSAYGNLTAIAARRTAILEAAQLKNTAATIMGANAEKAAAAASMARFGGWKTVGLSLISGPRRILKFIKGIAQTIAWGTALAVSSPRKSLMMLGRSLKGLFIGTLRIIGLAFSTLLSPASIFIGALVVGAFLIWKYWRPISAFFQGFGQGLQEAFRPAHPIFAKLITLFKNLLTPVQETGAGFKGATEAGVKFGRTVGSIISWVIDKIGMLISAIGTAGSTISHTVGSVEKFLGLGGNNPAPYTELPQFRQPAAAGAGGDVHISHSYNITQQPGQSSEDLAHHIHRISQQNTRRAPALADGPDGMMH